MEPKGIQQIAMLEDRLRKLTADFRQSREFVRLDSGLGDRLVSMDMKDFNLIAAATNSDVLVTGKSGGGKTHLAKMAMSAFYGRGGFVNRTITPGMNEEAFTDIDFGKIKSGATLKEAIASTPVLTRPGVILNEANRAPALIQNILIPYLEYEFNIKGLEFDVGVPLPDGQRYQLRILTINEGAEYKGVSETDKAVRDRMVIEIPIDQFKSLKQDIRDMVKKRKSSAITVADTKESQLETVLALYQSLSAMPLDAMASEFLVYLSGMSNCTKSCTGAKEGVAFTLDFCKGCHHAAADENICGNVYAPTNRSLINMQAVAKGVAALRAYKTLTQIVKGAGSDSKKARAVSEFMESAYLRDLRATCGDLLAIAPFILYSKIQVNEQWVKKFCQGNKFLAVSYVVKTAYGRFTGFYKDHGKEIARCMASGEQGELMSLLQKYAKEKDPWMTNIRDFENGTEEHDSSTADIIGGYKG